MAEGLNLDGAPLDVDETDFARAMAAPEPTEPVAEPPAAKDPDAPFGRDSSGKPKAPYGTHPDGKPKRSAGGRKPSKAKAERHDRARVQDTPQKPASGSQTARTAADYRQGLEQLLGTVWAVSAPFAPADAGAILQASPAIVDSWSKLAEHDPRVGRIVSRITETSVYGAAVSSLLMVGLQIAVNHRAIPQEAVAGLGVRPPEEMEAVNAAALGQFQAAQQAQQAA